MNDNFNTSTTDPAVSYVCTKTQGWQKYASFLLKMDAQKPHYEIVSEYRDYEGHDLNSNRQGFLQMVKDIESKAVPPLIVVGDSACFPTDMKALGIDDKVFEEKIRVVELESLGQ